MIVSTRRIFYDYNKPIYLKPIFDVHLGAAACDEHAFKAYLKDSDRNTYFLGGGDIMDSITVPDPRYRKSNDIIEDDAIIDEQIERTKEILYPYKNRILGLATGNHEDIITKKCGSNPTKRLCKELDVPFLGFSGLLRLSCCNKKYKDKPSSIRTIIVRYHHGWGGGSRTQGADLTKYSRDIANWDADLFLYGHVHRKQTDVIPRLGLHGSKLVSKPKIVCICGSFLKTYTDGSDPTYAEIKGYPPVEIGGVVIQIKMTRYHYHMKAYLD